MAVLASSSAGFHRSEPAPVTNHFVSPVLVLIAYLLLNAIPACAHYNDQPGVLILYFGSKDAPYAQTLKDEIVKQLNEHVPAQLTVYTDSVAGWSGPHDENDQAITRVLRQKYARKNIHLLIPIANSAVNFARIHGRDLFPEASIVYLAESFSGTPEVPPILDGTGVILRFDPESTLQLALQQNPGTREVVVIAGSSPQEKMELLATHSEFRRHEDSMKLHYVTDLTLSHLLRRVSKLPLDSVVILINFAQDSEGDEFMGVQILPSISRACNRPIYVLYSPGVGGGALGGRVHDFARIGRTIGGLAAKVLKGTRAGDLPPVEGTFQQTVFDWRQMQRWGISNKQLPAGSVVINREPTAWEKYRWWILGVFVVLGAQAGLLSVLIVARIRKARAEQELANEMELEALVSELAVAFVNLPSGQVGEQIEHGCKRLIRFFQVDRIAVYEFTAAKDSLRLIYGFSSIGVDAFPAGLQTQQAPWICQQALAGSPALITHLDDLTSFSAEDHRFLAGRGVRSVAVVPLQVREEVSGILVLTSVQQEVSWPVRVVERLQTVSYVFASALENKRAEEALQSAEDLKIKILDSLTSHLAVVSRTGKIVAVNRSWKEHWVQSGGADDGCMGVGANYLDVCRKAAEAGCREADRALAGILSVLEGNAEHFEMEYDASTPEEKRWSSMLVSTLRLGEGVVIRHLDTTFRNQALSMLRESEERFRLVADSAPVMIWMAGPDRLCNYFNKFWLDFRGRSMENEWGNGWKDGIHPEDLARCLRIYSESFDAQRLFTMEYRLRRADGDFRWVLENGVPRILRDGIFAGFIGACVDITEQKESDRARAQLSGLLITAQEQERASLARELHDHVNQRLALLAIELQQFEATAAHISSSERDDLEHLWDLTNEISHDVQALSHQLHSSQLQHLGLAAGIRSLCQEFSKGNAVEALCRCSGDVPRIDENVALALFRVAQEALRNISKYSHARNVAADLSCRGNVLTLQVTDDGVGFDPTATNGGGLGLISMRERMRLVGGDIVIRSRPGEGTRVEARVTLVPVAAEKFPPDTTVRVERRKRMRA